MKRLRPLVTVESQRAGFEAFQRGIAALAAPSGLHPVLEHLDGLEVRLVAAGWPAISPWWRHQLERFYGHRRRRFVGRVGRRGGKSSTLCRVAVLEALYGAHRIPPGDTGYVVFVSHTKKEAAERIATVRKILDVLGVGWKPIDGGIALTERNVAFRVFVATIAGVSGPTAICLIFDEVAKWRDADTGANPATEVLASARPMAATMPFAREFLVSSPMGTLDAHAKAYAEGDTLAQDVAHAPSWVANPTLTEEGTKQDEPDERKHAREYGAIPIEGNEEGIFLPTVLDSATRRGAVIVPPEHGWSYVAAMDPATRGNGWTLVVATRDTADRRIIVGAWEWRGSPSRPLDPDQVFLEMMGDPARDVFGVLSPYGIRVVYTDQWSGDALASIARRRKLVLSVVHQTAAETLAGYDDLAVMMRDRKVEIPEHPQMRSDLLGVRRHVTANGLSVRLTDTPDGRHCDFAPAVSLVLRQHCAAPRRIPQGTAELIEHDALQRDLEAANPKRGAKPWWAPKKSSSPSDYRRRF